MRVISIALIILGYWLLSVSPEAPFDAVVKRAWSGTIVTIAGGVLLVLHMFRNSR
ncbi:MAG: hypothetical protein HZA17_13465 [Nitrospirae bacterium]|nr:hypothetical protein [Nitrospirota bacterium]